MEVAELLEQLFGILDPTALVQEDVQRITHAHQFFALTLDLAIFQGDGQDEADARLVELELGIRRLQRARVMRL